MPAEPPRLLPVPALTFLGVESVIVTPILKFPELPMSFAPTDCAAWLATTSRIVPGLEWRRIYVHKCSIRVDYFVEFATAEIALMVKGLVNPKEGEIRESVFVGPTEYGEIRQKLRAALEQTIPAPVPRLVKPPSPYAGGRYRREEPPTTTRILPDPLAQEHDPSLPCVHITRRSPTGQGTLPGPREDPPGDLGLTDKENSGAEGGEAGDRRAPNDLHPLPDVAITARTTTISLVVPASSIYAPVIALPFEIPTMVSLLFTLELATSSPFEIFANTFSLSMFAQLGSRGKTKVDSETPPSRQEQILLQLQNSRLKRPRNNKVQTEEMDVDVVPPPGLLQQLSAEHAAEEGEVVDDVITGSSPKARARLRLDTRLSTTTLVASSNGSPLALTRPLLCTIGLVQFSPLHQCRPPPQSLSPPLPHHISPPVSFDDETFDLCDDKGLKRLNNRQLRALCTKHDIDTARSNEDLVKNIQAHYQQSHTAGKSRGRGFKAFEGRVTDICHGVCHGVALALHQQSMSAFGPRPKISEALDRISHIFLSATIVSPFDKSLTTFIFDLLPETPPMTLAALGATSVFLLRQSLKSPTRRAIDDCCGLGP
ncbi:hypothetical protein B0H13DRAFT_2336784 [Mycena leptocephala]|nr:hypothetical protein B0H13DRAFT_2336784 [Mycena leptocephala]